MHPTPRPRSASLTPPAVPAVTSRPRGAQKAQEPPKANGATIPTPEERAEAQARYDALADRIPVGHRAVFEAVEDLRMAIKAAGLPPLTVDWKTPPAEGETDPGTTAFVERLKRRMDDIAAIGADPYPVTIAHAPQPREADPFVVTGLMRPGTTVMLAGPAGSAKSWASRQLVLSAAAGLGTFLDRYGITRPLKALVVDEDNGSDEEWRREESLMAQLNTRRDVMVDVQRISLAGVMLDQARWQAWLRGLIEGGQLDLVVLDPISEMYGGKELRDDPPFRSLLGFLKRLKLDFPQLVTLLVHHTKKPGGNERSAPKSIEDVRGQWGQTPDVVIVMWPLGDRRLRWEVHKRVPHSALILEQNPGGLLINVADETTGATQRESTDNRVLTAIDAGATTADEIALGTGLSRRGVYKALSRLSEAELISKRQPFERIETAEDHEWTTPSDEELAR
jgi:hypothetical protein